MIDNKRVKYLNDTDVNNNGDFVVYWMQQSQRSFYNHALEFAISYANRLKKPLVVYFGITDKFPQANLRHFRFMLEGLKYVNRELQKRNIDFYLEIESPEKGIINFAKNACLVVTDRGYLKVQKYFRSFASSNLFCPLIEVESDVVVPVEEASIKEEYAAYTIRKKINTKLRFYLLPVKEEILEINTGAGKKCDIDLENIDSILDRLDIEYLEPSTKFKGGFPNAEKFLKDFLENKLKFYDEKRNDPCIDFTSNLSPYLHFGQISPIYIAIKVKEYDYPGVDAFLEELIVRRELSMNFINYNNFYDSFESLPNWAKQTLTIHKNDNRPYIYTLDELEYYKTHDRYWNACQKDMVETGKMHGYMRMYWGKKIIEWSKTPEEAFQSAIYLNNKYALDGRDANSFTGIAWCFGKHDRPWKERDVFGKVRYMNASGLKRKFNADLYADRIL